MHIPRSTENVNSEPNGMRGERKGEQRQKRCRVVARCSKLMTMISRGRERTMNLPGIYNFEANSDPSNEELGGQSWSG
jgi:hypothetical protein